MDGLNKNNSYKSGAKKYFCYLWLIADFDPQHLGYEAFIGRPSSMVIEELKKDLMNSGNYPSELISPHSDAS